MHERCRVARAGWIVAGVGFNFKKKDSLNAWKMA